MSILSLLIPTELLVDALSVKLGTMSILDLRAILGRRRF